MVERLPRALQMAEQMEADPALWGTTGSVRDWFSGKEKVVSGVRDELRYYADDVRAGLGEGGEVVCLNDMRPF
jgi:hypothetical protein